MEEKCQITRVRARISEGGRIVIPAEFRKALGLRIGAQVILELAEGELRILTLQQQIKRTQELVRSYFPADRSLADELIAERRAEAARE